jgi:hypothetical protein
MWLVPFSGEATRQGILIVADHMPPDQPHTPCALRCNRPKHLRRMLAARRDLAHLSPSTRERVHRANSSVATLASSTSAAVTSTASSKPNTVHHHVALPPVHILGVIAAPLLAAGGGVDRLAVDACGGAGVVGLLGGADLAAEQVMEVVHDAVATPLIEIPPGRAPGRQYTSPGTLLLTYGTVSTRARASV